MVIWERNKTQTNTLLVVILTSGYSERYKANLNKHKQKMKDRNIPLTRRT